MPSALSSWVPLNVSLAVPWSGASVTVIELEFGPLIVMVAGTATVIAWAGSPLTRNWPCLTELLLERTRVTPPESVMLPLASMIALPEPEAGRTSVPKLKSIVLVRVIGRSI